MHLFSFTDCHKWKQIRILHFTFFVHCAQVVLSHCTIRSAVCAGSQSNNPRFVTALLSAQFNSHRPCEGFCISRIFLLSYFGPLRERGFWFIAENHKTVYRNSVITILHPALLQYNCLTLQSTRYKNRLFFLLVIHSLQQNSDCCTRHQDTKSLAQITSRVKYNHFEPPSFMRLFWTRHLTENKT